MVVASVPTIGLGLLTIGVIAPLVLIEIPGFIGIDLATSKKKELKWWEENRKDSYGDFNGKWIDTKLDIEVNGKKSTLWELNNKGSATEIANKKVIIFVHGLRNTHWNIIETYKYWIKKGYIILAYDQRQAGQNLRNGKISFGQKEKYDLLTVYKAVAEKSPSEIVIYGQSNGAGTTIAFAEDEDANKYMNSKNVKTNFLLESVYNSWQEAIDRMAEAHGFSKWISSLFMKKPLEAILDVDVNAKPFSDPGEIEKIEHHLYIMQGTSDTVTPIQNAIEIYEASQKSNKNVFLEEYKGLGHIGITRRKDEAEVKKALDKALKMFENWKIDGGESNV